MVEKKTIIIPGDLPSRSITQTEDKHGDDKELVGVAQHDKENLGCRVFSEWTVSRDRERVGQDVKGQINVGLLSKENKRMLADAVA